MFSLMENGRNRKCTHFLSLESSEHLSGALGTVLVCVFMFHFPYVLLRIDLLLEDACVPQTKLTYHVSVRLQRL